MKLLLTALPLLLILSSCATQKRCERKFPPVERIDSIYIETIKEVYRDTTIYVDLPPVIIEKYVPITDTLTLPGSHSEARCWVIDDMITGRLEEGKKPVEIQYKIKEVEVVKEVLVEKETIRKEKYLPLWSKILSGLGAVLVFYLIFRVFFS